MEFSKHFKIQEFVPSSIYNIWGERSVYFLDPRMITLADFMRDFFGKPITINNWYAGGNFDLRGFRPPDTLTGGKLSQHKFGRAFDSNVEGLTPQEVYETIIKNEYLFRNAGLTTMEDINFTTGWNHLDIRWTGLNFIQIVKP